MPRRAREKSSTGIYHVMTRGINGQIIFEDNDDYNKFIQTIRKYKKICEYEIYAYCLMSNHIHLLIKEGKEDLGRVFRRIGASYVYWYNWKYKRSGPLFQDRYKSEVVEDDIYFLTVLRYIHQNPIKAGIENQIKKYPWSSYNEYQGKDGICDTRFALSLFANDKKRAIALFKKYNLEENKDKCLEYEERVRLDDIEATKMIKKVAGVENYL
ncbi:MAG: transposase [Tepidanaerobacteraceae bacterium]|nr:transposase [Tepidanaerobacteraceae bacterium]